MAENTIGKFELFFFRKPKLIYQDKSANLFFKQDRRDSFAETLDGDMLNVSVTEMRRAIKMPMIEVNSLEELKDIFNVEIIEGYDARNTDFVYPVVVVGGNSPHRHGAYSNDSSLAVSLSQYVQEHNTYAQEQIDNKKPVQEPAQSFNINNCI
jgi:hypothetical protein